MALQESGEMYLETILILSKYTNCIRAIDIGEHMGYSKPSVSRAVKLLKDGGYIKVHDDGGIVLTESGRHVAEKIYERHTVITFVLKSLGVSQEVAEADACRIEHVISDESFEKIKDHVKNRSK